MTFDLHQLDVFLLLGSLVTLVAILAVRVTAGAGLPSLLVYLFIGVALGDGGLGIAFDDAALAHALGFAALVLILAEGGFTTRWPEIRPVIRMGAALATVGVLASVAAVAVSAHYLLGFSWQLAILLGAVCSPTDAAAVFSVLRVVPLPRRLSATLEAESGLNDAPTVVLVTLVASGAFAEDGAGVVAAIIGYELVAGTLLGLAVGYVGGWLMRRAALPAPGLYPLAILSLAIAAYGVGAAVHASGFAAVYVATLVLGNSDLPHRGVTRSFMEGIGWLAQIGLFVMLGLLLAPERIDLRVIGLALGAGLLLTVVARPVSVLVSAVVQPMRPKELAFVSWAGLRGAVPIVLTTIPLAEGVAGAEELFDVVFVMVVVFTLLTGPTLPAVARWLGLTQRDVESEIEIETAPLERVAADLLHVRIGPHSRMHGVEVGELRMPPGASVALIIRGDETMVPERRTVLRRGDNLLVVTPKRVRARTDRRLNEVSRGGRLARWLASSSDRE